MSASLETSSFLFAHLCSHGTKHTACSQALESIPAAEASTFALSQNPNTRFSIIWPRLLTALIISSHAHSLCGHDTQQSAI